MKKSKAKDEAGKKSKTKGSSKDSKSRKESLSSKEARRQQHQQETAREETTELSHTERELLAIQIRNLEEKVLRRDGQIDRLQRSAQMYKERWEQEATDKSDTVEFLKKALKERAADLVDLQEKLIGFQQTQQKEKQGWDAQYAALQTLFNETRDKLTEENMRLVGKLSSLEEFRTQKDQMEKEMSDLKEELGNSRETHQQQLETKDGEITMEKERLRQEVMEQIEKLAEEFRRTTSDQMSFTIKKTILENAQLTSQAEKDAARTAQLTATNRSLQAQVQHLNNRVHILSQTETALTRKCASMKRILILIKEQEKTRGNEREETEKLKEKIQVSTRKIMSLENQVCELKVHMGTLRMEKSELERKVENYRSEASQHQHSADELGNLLLVSAKAIRKDIEEEDSHGETVKALLDLLIHAQDQTDIQKQN